MLKTNNLVFMSLQVISWIIFIGLSIDAAALLVNFIVSIWKPGLVGNLYQKLDLRTLYQQNQWVYFGLYSFVLSIAFMKATLFWIVIKMMHKIDLSKPFSSFVSEQIKKISACTLSIGLFSHIAREIARNNQHHGYATGVLESFWEDSQAYIFMAAVVYVIYIIFKKGIELQNENELTV